MTALGDGEPSFCLPPVECCRDVNSDTHEKRPVEGEGRRAAPSSRLPIGSPSSNYSM